MSGRGSVTSAQRRSSTRTPGSPTFVGTKGTNPTAARSVRSPSRRSGRSRNTPGFILVSHQCSMALEALPCTTPSLIPLRYFLRTHLLWWNFNIIFGWQKSRENWEQLDFSVRKFELKLLLENQVLERLAPRPNLTRICFTGEPQKSYHHPTTFFTRYPRLHGVDSFLGCY